MSLSLASTGLSCAGTGGTGGSGRNCTTGGTARHGHHRGGTTRTFAVRRARRRHDRLARPRLGASGAAPGGDAREGPRHLAGAHLGSRLERRPRRRPRPARPRHRAGRPGVDPLRGPARVGGPRHRHRRRAGHHRRPVPDQPGRRGRVPARRLAAPPCTSPRTRSRSTRCSPSPDTGAGLQRIVYLEPRGLASLPTTTGSSPGTTPRARAPAPRRQPRRRRAADGRGDRRRRHHPRVHVGDHRPAQGGDADQRQLRSSSSTSSSASPSACPTARRPGPTDLVVTYLPLCHVAERIFSTWHLVGAGVVLNFAESIDTVTTNLREVQPTLFFAVPRIWEKLHAGVLIKGNDASRYEARRVPPRHARRRPRSAGPRSPTAATTRRAAGCATRSGTRCCSGRCRSASDCAGAATHRRARPRSPPRSSSSSWASACRSSSCTG